MASTQYNYKVRFKDVPDVLAKIVQDKVKSIEALKATKPLESFIETLTPSTRSFYDALAADNTGFILECKKASPSKGLIREHFDVEEIAKTYNKYAAAISVLTEDKYFQGSFDYLATVSSIVDCPVLNKDFIFDPYQVYLARFYGADAILLMLSVLDDEQYLMLSELAAQYQLDVLTEVSNNEERDRAIALNAKIIGINNRDLRDLSTNLEQTFTLSDKIPDDRLVISESGIYTNHQVRSLAKVADGFLVGSSVMAQENIDLACRKLIYGEHKVCGLTRVEDALAAAKAGAVLGGLIFAEKSPRCIDLATAQEICSKAPALDYVGVFVNQPISDVVTAVNTLKLGRVQLHGDESDDYISELKQHLEQQLASPSCLVVKAQKVKDTLPTLSSAADGHLLDSPAPGSGQQFDWQLLDNSGAHTKPPTKAQTQPRLEKTMLAGGLSPENLEQALAHYQNYQLTGLDFNSGVEVSPGVKDANKLNLVFTFIRSY